VSVQPEDDRANVIGGSPRSKTLSARAGSRRASRRSRSLRSIESLAVGWLGTTMALQRPKTKPNSNASATLSARPSLRARGGCSPTARAEPVRSARAPHRHELCIRGFLQEPDRRGGRVRRGRHDPWAERDQASARLEAMVERMNGGPNEPAVTALGADRAECARSTGVVPHVDNLRVAQREDRRAQVAREPSGARQEWATATRSPVPCISSNCQSPAPCRLCDSIPDEHWPGPENSLALVLRLAA
jgi:hypothetical protein